MQLRSVSAVTAGFDAANPDAAIPVARSGHDLAAEPGDLGGMHLSDQPTGRPPGPAPRALNPSRHPTLRTTSDAACGRIRFDLNRLVFAATA
jgi:hypothetical protein